MMLRSTAQGDRGNAGRVGKHIVAAKLECEHGSVYVTLNHAGHINMTFRDDRGNLAWASIEGLAAPHATGLYVELPIVD